VGVKILEMIDRSEYIKKKMRDYIRKGVGDVPYPSLIRDMQQYAKPKKSRAYRVFLRCISRKHFKWALEIERKHGYLFPVKSDLVMASQFAMLAEKDARIPGKTQ